MVQAQTPKPTAHVCHENAGSRPLRSPPWTCSDDRAERVWGGLGRGRRANQPFRSLGCSEPDRLRRHGRYGWLVPTLGVFPCRETGPLACKFLKPSAILRCDRRGRRQRRKMLVQCVGVRSCANPFCVLLRLLRSNLKTAAGTQSPSRRQKGLAQNGRALRKNSKLETRNSKLTRLSSASECSRSWRTWPDPF